VILLPALALFQTYHEKYLMASDGIILLPGTSKFDRKFVLEFSEILLLPIIQVLLDKELGLEI